MLNECECKLLTNNPLNKGDRIIETIDDTPKETITVKLISEHACNDTQNPIERASVVYLCFHKFLIS